VRGEGLKGDVQCFEHVLERSKCRGAQGTWQLGRSWHTTSINKKPLGPHDHIPPDATSALILSPPLYPPPLALTMRVDPKWAQQPGMHCLTSKDDVRFFVAVRSLQEWR
jgi:hypothetical protein